LRKIILSLLILFFSQWVYADTTVHRVSSWNNVKFEGRIKDPWLYLLESDVRIGNGKSFLDRGTIRSALGYELKEHLTLWLGYDFKPIYEDDDGDFNLEQRIWQQVKWDLINKEHFIFTSRTRFEQRTRMDSSGVALRLRQRFIVELIDLFDSKITPIIYEELFFNLNHPEWINDDTLNQQRAFFGFQFPLQKHVNLRLGYINQYLIREPHNIMNHVIYVSLRRDTI